MKKSSTQLTPSYSTQTTNYHTTPLNIPNAYQTSSNNQLQMEQQAQIAIIDQTLNGGSIDQSSNNLFTVNTSIDIKVEKTSNKSMKKKNDKRFLCCYCSWSGNDNWGLKRHLNTHTKPFFCVLCEYKAARAERLATHVSKVHNKKVCTKCNYLADNQNEYNSHVYEAQ